MRFLVDMALSPDLASWLRSQGNDAVHAADLALNRPTDSPILSTALDGERVMISADLNFPRLALAGAGGPGLICSGAATTAKPKASNGSGVLMSVPVEDLPSSIVVVDHKSVRRRPLPL